MEKLAKVAAITIYTTASLIFMNYGYDAAKSLIEKIRGDVKSAKGKNKVEEKVA